MIGEGKYGVGYYTVTIASTPSSGTQTTMRIDTSGPAPRITEFAVRNDDPTGLTAVEPTIDLDLLLRALFPPAEHPHPRPPAAPLAPGFGQPGPRRHTVRPLTRVVQQVKCFRDPT